MKLLLERRFDQRKGPTKKLHMATMDRPSFLRRNVLAEPAGNSRWEAFRTSESEEKMGGVRRRYRHDSASNREASPSQSTVSRRPLRAECLGARRAARHRRGRSGNIGNLHMEPGEYDEAFATYQEVLGIEMLQLGLSHPQVAVTLHNIATIECSRGNFADGVSLYMQVVRQRTYHCGFHTFVPRGRL
jgi:hypothetical protein